MGKTKINKKKMIKRLLLSTLVIIIIALILYFIFKKLGLLNISKEELQDKIASFGALGPFIFIILSFLQVTILPIPGMVTILVGNYLFGFALSYIYSFIGMLLGSLFAFFLGRKFGRPIVNWIVGDSETVDYYLKKLKGKETIILFFMFLLPVFPDDTLCAIAGITPISFSMFATMQVITRITSIGGTLLFMSGDIIPTSGLKISIMIVLSLAALILFVFAYRNSDAILDKLTDFANKIVKKKNKDK